MLAIRTRYDGKQIDLPAEARPPGPCEVIVLFEAEGVPPGSDWTRLQEQAFEKAWSDEEDAVYDEA
jgi:hypothetical protein